MSEENPALDSALAVGTTNAGEDWPVVPTAPKAQTSRITSEVLQTATAPPKQPGRVAAGRRLAEWNRKNKGAKLAL